MIIWNVTLYEPLPVNGDGVRLMRSGLLSNALSNSGHDIELWLPGFEHVHHYHFRSKSQREKLSENYYIQYISGCGYKKDTSPKRFIHNQQIAKEFYRLARERETLPDLILTQIPALELAESVAKFANQFSIPLIVDIRDLWPDVYQRFFPSSINFLYKLIFFKEIQRASRVLKRATCITAVSKEFLDWGIAYADRDQSEWDKVFHIGYPGQTFKELSACEITHISRKYGIDPQKLIFFFAGTFCDSYDLETVFKSAEIIRKNGYTNAHIIIAGEGKEQNRVQKICNHLENMTYVGWLDANELKQFLSLAHVGLAPYSANALMSLPNKPFEYMAASLPTLNSLKGELEKIINKKKIGLNYRAGDADSLSDAIMRICDDRELLKELGNNGRQLFNHKFNSEKIYSDFVKHIEVVNHEFGRTKNKRN